MPAATPPTTPVLEPAVATDASLLLHVPPPPSVNVIVDPVQTDEGPEIADGNGFTVTGVVAVAVHVIASVTVNV